MSSLFDTLRESDPNTTTDIVVQDGHFHRAFLCPGACSRAFGLSLHVIGVDGCHLKTKYGGVLFVATALDGNSNIFPICIGIAEGENSDSWTWFLRNARVALGIGEGTGVVVLSDMEKGLERALADVLPQAQHSLCLFHIEKNFVKKFKTNMNGVLWKAAKCTTQAEFHECIDALEVANPAAASYVRLIDPKKWARSYFLGRRFGHLTSNIAESSNSWLEEPRRLNPTDLFSSFIRKVNALFLARREVYSTLLPNALPDRVASSVAASIESGRTLKVVQNAENLFEVQRGPNASSFRVVDTHLFRCSCGLPQETALPCCHISAALMSVSKDPRETVPFEMRAGTLLGLYGGSITPVDTSTLAENGLEPPHTRRGRGRPRLKRVRSAVERKHTRTVKCSRCGKADHNARSCRYAANETAF